MALVKSIKQLEKQLSKANVHFELPDNDGNASADRWMLEGALYLAQLLRRLLNLSADVQIAIYAYDHSWLGVRFAELALISRHPGGGMAGSSYMRCDAPGLAVLTAAEEVWAKFDLEPEVVDESTIDDRADAEWVLKHALGLDPNA